MLAMQLVHKHGQSHTHLNHAQHGGQPRERDVFDEGSIDDFSNPLSAAAIAAAAEEAQQAARKN
eukprot:SAG22_NODE_8918_length_621_cov_1.078544_1_plen_63_part_10